MLEDPNFKEKQAAYRKHYLAMKKLEDYEAYKEKKRAQKKTL